MRKKNKLAQPFFTVLASVFALFILSFFNVEVNIWGYQTKKIALFSDVLKKGLVQAAPLPQPLINDSLLLVYVSKDSSFAPLDPIAIIDYKPDTGAIANLDHFLESLNLTKQRKKKTRIAYFGDSMIEGDLITQDLRSYMQDTFGGDGVGFVPITSIVANFRTSIRHSFGEWTTYNLNSTNIPKSTVLGISGYGFLPEMVELADTSDVTPDSWVKYTATSKKHLDKFYELKLLYGKSDASNYVIINGRRYELSGQNSVNQLHIDACRDSASVNAGFQCTSPVNIYGFSFESSNGVFVDNFSFRGNSGMPISKVSKDVYAGTHQCLKYDLIILGYGLNALSPNVKDFSWYERGMDNTIKYIKQCFPNTSILLISVGDRGFKKDGVFQTDPSVPVMVQTQKRLAQKNGLAFWSLYDAMGGHGSMVRWVEGDTVYANKDYTHFNFKGAHRIGKMLFDKLMHEHENYNVKKTTSNPVN
jgi:hypothetical protein